MPGATYHLTLADHAEFARPIADRKAGDQAVAQATTLVWTPVEQAVELTVQIEDADRPPADGEHFVSATRDLCNGGDDVPLHDRWWSISRPHAEPSRVSTSEPSRSASQNGRILRDWKPSR